MKIVLGVHVVYLSYYKDNLKLKTKINNQIIVISNDMCYNNCNYGGVKIIMIVSFKCKHTKELWLNGEAKKFPPEIQKTALRKLWQLDNAELLKDLQAPPNNRLEPLKNDRLGQHSIRINNQWRICFVWENRQVKEVEIVDYH